MQACVHDASFLVAMERRLIHAGYEVATYFSALHLLVNLPTESIPSCILLGVRIPGLDGPALQKRLAELGSTLPIIFLTGYIDIPVTVRAIKSGAADVLTKPVSSDDLLRAIEGAIAHHEVMQALKGKLVFDLVICGKPNKLVARALGCTERTSRRIATGVMEKMQVRTLPELVSLAERIGVVSATRQTI